MNTIRLFCLLGVTAAGAAELPTLSIDLGHTNRGSGLSVPSAGDGRNVPGRSAAGIAFRRMAPGSSYLYVRIDDPAYTAAAPLDLYVIADFLDDEFHRVSVQYDKAAPKPSIATKYTAAEGVALLTGRSRLRTVYFFLPQARIGHGENNGTDFRFSSGGLAVHRIKISPRRPESFSGDGGLDPASIAALRVERSPGMELTIGNDANDADAAILQALTVTSVESYVDWAGVEPNEQGGWDWSKWDRQVDILRRHGLRWVPFLIAGPAYATPLWFQESEHSHCFECLEHGKPSKVQSIFNPDWPPYVERFLKAFAARYGKTGMIESMLLGVTGIYGESIYPAGPEGGWTARFTGPYHNHAGWWAGDAYALAAFQKAMRRKYWFLRRLNAAWNSQFKKWPQVKTFLPANAPNDRARADMAQWYQLAMTNWAAFWVKTARDCFPETEIYLCTGGNGAPKLGADFTAQAEAIAPWLAGIRITNEGSDIAANFTVTREVATATHLYGTFAGFEPAGRVDSRGVVARIFNATASGAHQLHYYQGNLLQSGTALNNFRKNARFLVPRHPRIRTALYVSRETWEVDAGAIGPLYAHARRLRDAVDYDMVTRRSVRNGALRGRRALILVGAEVLEPDAARTIRRWVESGGLLIAAGRSGRPPASRLYDLKEWRNHLLAVPPAGEADGLLRRELVGPGPGSWLLELGSPGDSSWIFGDWWDPERALEWSDFPEARKRWSGAGPGVFLPTCPGAAYRLRLDAYLSGHSTRPTGNTVLVNGVKVGRLAVAGRTLNEFTVPAAILGKNTLARLELHMNTWVPKEHSDSADARQLGVALHTVEWIRDGAQSQMHASATLCWTVDQDRLPKLVKRVRKGWTVFLPDWGDNPEKLARLTGELLRHTDLYFPGVPQVAPEDGRLDGVYTTRTEKGYIRYDADRAVITTETE